jgi:hypothetical protein
VVLLLELSWTVSVVGWRSSCWEPGSLGGIIITLYAVAFQTLEERQNRCGGCISGDGEFRLIGAVL